MDAASQEVVQAAVDGLGPMIAVWVAVAIFGMRLVNELVDIIKEMIRKKRNGGNGRLVCPVNAGREMEIQREISKEHLEVTRSVAKSSDLIVYELRALALVHGHTHETVKALHRRLDKQ